MKAKEITLGGIMIALTTIILYSTSIIPISTLTILTIASAIVPVVIIRSNIKTAIFVYIASSILAFFFAQINISVLYAIFFGVYGIVKYFTERIRKNYLEIIFKLLFFNFSFILGYVILQAIVGIDIISNLGGLIGNFIEGAPEYLAIIILWAIAQVVFYIYDYALTLIITFYLDRIHGKGTSQK